MPRFTAPPAGRVYRGTLPGPAADAEARATRISDIVTDEPWAWLGELWPLTADISKLNGRQSLRVVTWDGAGNVGSSRTSCGVSTGET